MSRCDDRVGDRLAWNEQLKLLRIPKHRLTAVETNEPQPKPVATSSEWQFVNRHDDLIHSGGHDEWNFRMVAAKVNRRAPIRRLNHEVENHGNGPTFGWSLD